MLCALVLFFAPEYRSVIPEWYRLVALTTVVLGIAAVLLTKN